MLGGEVYFLRRDEQLALWKTDGTAAGTVEVTLFPPEVNFVGGMLAAGSHLALIAYHDVTDLNFLWLSDGTAAGTFQMPLGGNVDDLAATPGRLWLATGRRLHQLDADSPEGGTDGRFRRQVADGGGSPATGFARSISERAGALSYFRRGSPELIVKIHDGRRLNGHFWVFAGSLTNLSYDLAVTDTVTGAQRIYTNPPGRVGGFADIQAFAGSPRP